MSLCSQQNHNEAHLNAPIYLTAQFPFPINRSRKMEGHQIHTFTPLVEAAVAAHHPTSLKTKLKNPAA